MNDGTGALHINSVGMTAAFTVQYDYYVVRETDVLTFLTEHPGASEIRIKKYRDPFVTDEEMNRFAKLIPQESQ